MTRWLQAARQATGAGTELTKPTKRNQGQVNNTDNTTHAEVLSVLSILSEGERQDPAPVQAAAENVPVGQVLPDAAVYLGFLKEHGPQSYGAVARALGWGATRAWQAEAQLRAAGRIPLPR